MATNRKSNTLYGSSREDVSEGFALKIDEAGGGVTYIGKAKMGSISSSAVWRVIRITEAGAITDIEYADGNDYLDNIWDNRSGLSYS